MRIDAKNLHYRQLNESIRQSVALGNKDIVLDNVKGQRYIGTALPSGVKITINGVPGNDLAAFMDGPTIIVTSNAQDAIGNTMNQGTIIVHGDSGDTVGHSMRGGKIHIRGNAGYRVGIHMKAYKDSSPVIIIGGCAGDYLGEYMAGGVIIVLGLNKSDDEPIVGNYCATGMHGGVIYIRGQVQDYQMGKEVKKFKPDDNDIALLRQYLQDYCNNFSLDLAKIINGDFVKLIPCTHRPYGKLYAY